MFCETCRSTHGPDEAHVGEIAAPDSSSLVLPSEISEAIEAMRQCAAMLQEDYSSLAWQKCCERFDGASHMDECNRCGCMEAIHGDKARAAVLHESADLLLRVETARQELARQVQGLQKDTHVDSTSPSGQQATGGENELTPAQLDCGYCLYGPPALCTCGTCDVDEDEQEAAAADLLDTLKAITPEVFAKELQGLRDHLHVAEQERDELKEDADATAKQFDRAIAQRDEARWQRDALRSALTQQIAEWELIAREAIEPNYTSGLNRCISNLKALLTEGRSQDGQP